MNDHKHLTGKDRFLYCLGLGFLWLFLGLFAAAFVALMWWWDDMFEMVNGFGRILPIFYSWEIWALVFGGALIWQAVNRKRKG